MNFDDELESMPEDDLDFHLRTMDKLMNGGTNKVFTYEEREQFRLNLLKRLDDLKSGKGTLKW